MWWRRIGGRRQDGAREAEGGREGRSESERRIMVSRLGQIPNHKFINS